VIHVVPPSQPSRETPWERETPTSGYPAHTGAPAPATTDPRTGDARRNDAAVCRTDISAPCTSCSHNSFVYSVRKCTESVSDDKSVSLLEQRPRSPSLALVANLADNALRHNVAGGWVAISTTTTAGGASISVRNTGAVIPVDQVERLLQPFQQLGDEQIRHTGGHGLGLAIVQAIAGAHGATFVARAQPVGRSPTCRPRWYPSGGGTETAERETRGTDATKRK